MTSKNTTITFNFGDGDIAYIADDYKLDIFAISTPKEAGRITDISEEIKEGNLRFYTESRVILNFKRNPKVIKNLIKALKCLEKGIKK